MYLMVLEVYSRLSLCIHRVLSVRIFPQTYSLHLVYKGIPVLESECRISSVFEVLNVKRFISFQTGGKKKLATYKSKHNAQENNGSSYIAAGSKGHNNPIKISTYPY